MAASEVIYSRHGIAPQAGAQTLFNIVEGERKMQQDIQKEKTLEGFRNELTMKRDAVQNQFHLDLETLRDVHARGQEAERFARTVAENVLTGQSKLGAMGTMATNMASMGHDMGDFVNATPGGPTEFGMDPTTYTPKQFDPRSADFVTKVFGEHIESILKQQGDEAAKKNQFTLDLMRRKLDLVDTNLSNQAHEIADFLELNDPGNSYIPFLRGVAPGSMTIREAMPTIKSAMDRREAVRGTLMRVLEQGKVRLKIANDLTASRIRIEEIKAKLGMDTAVLKGNIALGLEEEKQRGRMAVEGAKKDRQLAVEGARQTGKASANVMKDLNTAQDNLRGNLGTIQRTIATYERQLETSSGAMAEKIMNDMAALRMQEKEVQEQLATLSQLEHRLLKLPDSSQNKDYQSTVNALGNELMKSGTYRKYKTPADMPPKLQERFKAELRSYLRQRGINPDGE